MPDAVLFLDIDGVLNCRTSYDRPRVGQHRIDRDKVALLNDVVRRSGCKVVVSSTWRAGKRCRDILRDYGFRGRFASDWRTPEYPDTVRGAEINAWLWANRTPRYAIVDDDGDMLPDQLPRFVQTSFDTGLLPEHVDRLVGILTAGAPDARR